MKPRLMLWAWISLSLIFLPQVTTAQNVCDPMIGLAENFDATSAIAPANPSIVYGGQSFKAPAAGGEADGIKVFFSSLRDGATIELSLHEGTAPGSITTPIATVSHTQSGGNLSGPLCFQFANPVELTPDGDYYFLVTTNCNTTGCAVAFQTSPANTNPYPDGTYIGGSATFVSPFPLSLDMKFSVYDGDCDDQAPMIQCNNITVNPDGQNTYSLSQADVDAIANGTTDNCPNFLSYEITNGQTDYTCANDGRSFSVTLTATDGCENTSECTASVTVDCSVPCEVAITSPPQNVEICDGDGAQFSVSATGTGTLSYQWFGRAAGGSFAPLPGATSSTLNFAGLGTVASGNEYQVEVTSDNGTPGNTSDDCSVTSAAAILTVNALPEITFPNPDAVCIDAGIVTLGGATPQGGEYMGDGVTDNNDGQTFDFDPATAGAGTTTITYTFTTPAGWNIVGDSVKGLVAGDRLGNEVDVSRNGNRFIAGAPSADPNGQSSGQALVFEWDGSTWVQIGQFDGNRLFEFFGQGVAISPDGNRIAIGSGTSSIPRRVDVYDWNGATWMQVGSSIAEGGAAGGFGSNIDFSDDGMRIAIGAPGTGADKTFVYDFDGANWVQVGNTLVGDRSGDRFGTDVKLSADGSILVVGAPESNIGLTSPRTGYVKVYELIGAVWTQIGQKLVGLTDSDNYGDYVDINLAGTRIAISNTGQQNAQVFDYDNGSNMWVQAGSDVQAAFPSHVSLDDSGDKIVVPDNTSFTTKAKIYDWNGTSWIEDPSSDFNSFAAPRPKLSGDGTRIVMGNSQGNNFVQVYEKGTGCTNTATAEILVEVCNQPPMPVCQDLVVAADDNCQGTAEAVDFDGGSSDPDGDDLTFSVDPMGPYPLGETMVTLTVSDGEEEVTCMATITVNDSTKPVFSRPRPPRNVMASCGEIPEPAVLTATDNCDGPVEVMYEQTDNGGAGFEYDPLIITRTWTATDAAGNTRRRRQTITVIDCPDPCNIEGITVGSTTTRMMAGPVCNGDGTYDVEICIQWKGNPMPDFIEIEINGTGGFIQIPIDGPQDYPEKCFTLEDLPANGRNVMIFARIGREGCTYRARDLFRAPDRCDPPPTECDITGANVQIEPTCDNGTVSTCIMIEGALLPQDASNARAFVGGQPVEITQYTLVTGGAVVCFQGLRADGGSKDFFFQAEPGCSITKRGFLRMPRSCDGDPGDDDDDDCDITGMRNPVVNCDGNGTYSLTFDVTYNDMPNGQLAVEVGHGANKTWSYHAVTGSPQTITVTGLPAVGGYANVFIKSNDARGCTWYERSWYRAPADCGRGRDGEFTTSLDQVRVYPNPSAGQFFLLIEQDKTEMIEVAVSNAVGQVVKTIKVESNREEVLDLEGMPEGIYTLRIMQNDQPVFKQIQVQR